MTQQTIIADSQHASICIGALKRDVFALLHEAAEYNVTIQFQDAKLEVARVGTGIVNPGDYDKNGPPRDREPARRTRPAPPARPRTLVRVILPRC